MPMVNFLSNFLLGTPTDSEQKAKAIEEEEDDDNPPPSAAEGGVPKLPRRSVLRAAVSRSRSLSRVYNHVPSGRPNFRQAQQDLIEYYAHLAMLENDTERIQEEDSHLRDALHGCNVRKYGRLYSRIQITSMSISIGVLSEPDAEGEEEIKSAQMWNEFREQLMIVKSYLLRKDANLDIPIERAAYEDEFIPPEIDELDAELDKHEMFQDSYQEVLLLLQVQETIACLLEKVKVISADSADVVKELEVAVNSYENDLQTLFMPKTLPRDTNIGEKTTISIPSELRKFLLPDLYKKPEEAIGSLQHHALDILSDEKCLFSINQLKLKMKSVLTKWSESILEIPKLVELGYGGVMAPTVVADDEDDVSSYGVDEDRLLTQKPEDIDMDVLEDDEPIPLRSKGSRRTSFADKAHTVGNGHQRRLPSKAPRSKPVSRRSSATKSPPRSRQGSTAEDFEPMRPDDDESEAKDPTSSVHQLGGAEPSPVANSLRQLVGAVRIRGSDEDAEEEGENRAPTPKKQKTTPDDDDLWEDPKIQSQPKQRTYLDWTGDETAAVVDGYARFGKKWRLIKDNCQNRLSRRTNIQIKDKWRTLVKQGEITD